MSKTAEGSALVEKALSNIGPGQNEIPDSMSPEMGMPEVLSMKDLLAGMDVLSDTPAEEPSEEPETSTPTETPEKGKDASQGQPEAKDETEVDPLAAQYSDFGKAILSEWESNPAQVAADFFNQMNARQQQEFIQSVTGEAKTTKAQTSLPQGYEPQSELEEVFAPFVQDIQSLPVIRQQMQSVTEAVTNQIETGNYSAAHNHALETIIMALAESIGFTIPEYDLKDIVDASSKAKSFKEGAKKVLSEGLKKSVNNKRQATKSRPLDATASQSDVPVYKVGESAVSILNKLMGAGN